MAESAKLEITKVVVPPAIALFIAIVGWVLTSRYNATQIAIATQRADADIEVARINAALRYMEFLRSASIDDTQKRQAIAIAAPVLPLDLAFRLAVDQLSDDSAALDTLMAKYGSAAYPELARNLEVPFSELKQVVDFLPETSRFSAKPSERERRAVTLMRYLRERGYSDPLFAYVTSDDYENHVFRPIILILYFDDYQRSLEADAGYVVQQAYENVRTQEEFRAYMEDDSLSEDAKQAITFAASIVFGKSDTFIREAAERFWHGVDVARGSTPVEGSLQSHIYQQVFSSTEAVEIASASLRDAVRSLSPSRLGSDNIRLVLYAYAASPNVASRHAYLVPAHVVQVMRWILAWANTPERRAELSMVLGSLTGHHLFFNMLPGRTTRGLDGKARDRCAAAKRFAQLLLDWYNAHHTADWYIPKFFHVVASEFPELAWIIHEGR